MKLNIRMKISATPEQVWKVFAHQFDQGDKWISAVARSYSNEQGKLFDGAKSRGRIIEMKYDGTGMKASERFIEYDESAKKCLVKVEFINASKLFPIEYNSLDFSVVQDDEKSSIVHWVYGAKIKPMAFLIWPLLKMGMSKGWKEMSEDFKYYLETGKPHPRKVTALEKQKR